MVKLSASEMVSPKSVICGDTMQLACILLAPSLINSLKVVTNTCTKGYLHLYDLWSLHNVVEIRTLRIIWHVLRTLSAITRYFMLPARSR